MNSKKNSVIKGVCTGILYFLYLNLGAQTVPIWKFNQLEKAVRQANDTVYVVNFWATWCGPCVKEIPEFVHLYQTLGSKKAKLLLVSLDFKKDIIKVQNFVEKNNIEPNVVLLDEPNYNQWMDKAEPAWQGAIPATLFIKNSQNIGFINKQTDFEKLESTLNSLL